MFSIKAACISNTGKKRKNNEDNFYFDGKYLPADKPNMLEPLIMETDTEQAFVVSVFDGMGGENYGEVASYAAAKERAECERNRNRGIGDREYLHSSAEKLNAKVVENAGKLLVRNMGSTLVELLFDKQNVYVSNMGDSRAYLLRDGQLSRLTADHCDEKLARIRADGSRSKAPITRYLGIDPEEYMVEPAISEHPIQQGDMYLICSDGVTDMINDPELCKILSENPDPVICAEKLVEAALEAGGKDNITAIVCRADRKEGEQLEKNASVTPISDDAPTEIPVLFHASANSAPAVSGKAKRNKTAVIAVIGAAAALAVILLILTNFICFKHDYSEPDCTRGAICGKCGKTVGSALGHNWQEANCSLPKTCVRCGETEGSTLEHDWLAASCEQPETCTRCGEMTGSALGHSWQAADCESPRTCSVCGETDGSALGHDWLAASCEQPRICRFCSKTDGSALGHSWTAATCESPRTCTVCGKTEGAAHGHDMKEASCESPAACKVCGKTEGTALGHDMKEASCEFPAACKVCGQTEGTALGHDMKEATCESPAVCMACGKTEGRALGHRYTKASIFTPETCERCGITQGSRLSCEIGDVITFGVYEQDNNPDNGPEKAEWIVLDKKGSDILVISRYTLDCMKYAASQAESDWAGSDLRNWLNNDFINSAFSEAECSRIKVTTICNENNPKYHTGAGNDTQDKVFLLSLAEAEEYFTSDSERVCGVTDYAIAHGAAASGGISADGRPACWWWLRSPGFKRSFAAHVCYDGSLRYYGGVVYLDGASVRPAMWIKLEG